MDQLTGLLLSAQQGDREALERFVVATHHDVMVMCRYLGDRDNTEDLAQESYERAIASLHRYRASGPAKNWLLTITRRTCADATRRRSRRRKLEQRLTGFARDDIEFSLPTGTHAELDEFLHDLEPDRRAAFVVTQINGLRYKEAADVLGVPVGTIRSRVSRAREELVEAITAAEAAAVEEPNKNRLRPYA